MRKEVSNQIFRMYEEQHSLKSIRDKKILKHRLTRRMSPLILRLVDKYTLMVVTPRAWQESYPLFGCQLRNGKSYKSPLQAIVMELLKAIAQNQTENSEARTVAYGHSLSEKQKLQQNELDKIDLECAFQYGGENVTLEHLVDKLFSGDEEDTQILLEMIEASISRKQELAKRGRVEKREAKKRKIESIEGDDEEDDDTIATERTKANDTANRKKRKMPRPSCPYVQDEAVAGASSDEDEDVDEIEEEEEMQGDPDASHVTEADERHHFQNQEYGGHPRTVSELVLEVSDSDETGLDDFLHTYGEQAVPGYLAGILKDLASEHLRLKSSYLQRFQEMKKSILTGRSELKKQGHTIEVLESTRQELESKNDDLRLSLKKSKRGGSPNKEDLLSQIKRLEVALKNERARKNDTQEMKTLAKEAGEDRRKVVELEDKLKYEKGKHRECVDMLQSCYGVMLSCQHCKEEVRKGQKTTKHKKRSRRQ